MNTARFLPFFAIASLMPLPALAQDNAQLMQRLDQLENEVQLLQKQVATGAPAPSGSSAAAPADAASLDVQISNLEDELRGLRGQIEDNQHQIQKLSDTMDKLQKDTDFRFDQLTKNAPPPAATTPATPPASSASSAPANHTVPADEETANGMTTAGDGKLHPPEHTGGDTENDFATPREHYHYAFRLLNEAQYPQAAASFAAFIKKYPNDPLIGNAWYWEGETYYIRRDYVTAADDFRQGFEALPGGPKAADNLFKLALSLDAMNRDKEACVVLQQVAAKFKKSTPSLVQRADQEQKRIGCR